MGLDQSLCRKMPNGETREEIYWRKTNFVHKYFTDGWQEHGFESDNCTDFPVTVEDLKTLVEMCEHALDNRLEAPSLLPTMSGFFFGSTDYSDWYWHDVAYTAEEVKKLLDERPLKEGEEFFYNAWY